MKYWFKQSPDWVPFIKYVLDATPQRRILQPHVQLLEAECSWGIGRKNLV
jgi:hypothetical protein